MLKEKNKIINCHPEVLTEGSTPTRHPEAFAEGSIHPRHPELVSGSQSGRSMVEMLGVLAVMGVLSVGGVAMYTSAMNKHRANEILNEASKRAVMVAGQAMAGKTGTISLSEFGNNAVSGATFGTEAKVENNQIKLTLSGVEDSICTKMKAALGDNTVMAMDDKCTVIAFNADMTKGVAKPTSCNPACTGGKECVNGTCQCPDDKSFWNGSTCVAKATCTENQWYNANTNQCDAKATCTSSQWYNAIANTCDAKKNCFGDTAYYVPVVNSCWYIEECEEEHLEVDSENYLCHFRCPTGSVAFRDPYGTFDCCPNSSHFVMGQCANSTIASCSPERIYCSWDWPNFYYGDEGTDGPDGHSCVDGVFCCDHDLETGADGYKWCCPTGKTLTCNGEDCSCQ